MGLAISLIGKPTVKSSAWRKIQLFPIHFQSGALWHSCGGCCPMQKTTVASILVFSLKFKPFQFHCSPHLLGLWHSIFREPLAQEHSVTHFSRGAPKKRTLFDQRNRFIHGFITTISRDYKPTPRGKELRLFFFFNQWQLITWVRALSVQWCVL